MSNGEFGSYEGCIRVGPWGGSDGDAWTYKPPAPIKEIIIVHGGGVIDSIRFKSQNDDGLDEYSVMFGGSDIHSSGKQTDKIGIYSPLEYLTNISGTFEILFGGIKVLKSLCFHTNLTQYGPFGSNNRHAFSSLVESGGVVGFFGRSDSCVNAVGIYIAPKSSICATVPKQENFRGKEISCVNVMKGDAMPREVGAWGGSGGKPWDDGVFSLVKEVRLDTKTFPTGDGNPAYAVTTVQFVYVNHDGRTVLSPMYGRKWGLSKIIKMDGMNEFLVGVSGFYAPITYGGCRMEAITSITFYTNKGRYGPYGNEFGTYFTSISSAGKVVGFHGRSGICLNAIGVHTEYMHMNL